MRPWSALIRVAGCPTGEDLTSFAADAVLLAADTKRVVALTWRWAQLGGPGCARLVLVFLALTGPVSARRRVRDGGWPDWSYFVAEPGWWSPAMAVSIARFAVPLEAADLGDLRRLFLAGPDHLTTATARFRLQAGRRHLLPQHDGHSPRVRRVLANPLQAWVDPPSPYGIPN